MKRAKYVFDFENTSIEPNHVYMMSLCSIDATCPEDVTLVYDHSHKNHHQTIAKAVDTLFSLKNNSILYAHNLSHDISFILCYLFKYKRDRFTITNSVIMPLTKSYLQIEIVYNGKKLEFRDSFILFSAQLSDVLKAYTDLEKTETPLFDYVEDVIIDSYVVKYSKIDVYGLAIALKKRLEIGNNKLTTASGAMSTFKELVNKKLSNNFDNLFKPLIPELDKVIRKAYRGGYTFLNPQYKEKKLHDVNVIDVNSMYPSQMKNKVLPYGEPYYIEGKVETNALYKLGIQKIDFDSCVIKEGYVPFISVTNSFTAVNNYEVIIEESRPIEHRTLTLTIEELELFIESYEIRGLRYIDGYVFQGRIGYFDEYIEKFWQMKLSSNPVIKALGKLFLNALYGKFAEGIEKLNFNIDYDDLKGLTYNTADIEIKPCGYLPMGIFITSYSRLYLIETINHIGIDNFVYCDTDSIHYINNPSLDGLDIHPSRLGAWDYEGHYTDGYYIRAKKYCLKQDDGKLKIACAGIKHKDLYREITDIDMFRSGRKINSEKFRNGVNGKHTEQVTIQI